MARKTHSVRLYLIVYAALLVLLVITFILSWIDLGRYVNNGLAEGIAVAKAVLIVLFFMHVRYEPRGTWLFAAAGFVWLAIMLALTLTDYVTRNHPAGMSPRGEPVFVSPQTYRAPDLDFARR